MQSPETCPFCHEAAVVHGHTHNGGYWSAFTPHDLVLSAWKRFMDNVQTPMKHNANACVVCGKVWGELNVDDLRKVLRTYGTAEARTRHSRDLS